MSFYLKLDNNIQNNHIKKLTKEQIGGLGITGATGAIGPIGNTGPAGLGFLGNTGTTGDIGGMGITGPIGLGFPGSTGMTGDIGAMGIAGEKGSIGFSSNSGDTGSIGPIGPLGPIGDNGFIGSKGATGSTGDIGAMGITGEKGSTGQAGPLGQINISLNTISLSLSTNVNPSLSFIDDNTTGLNSSGTNLNLLSLSNPRISLNTSWSTLDILQTGTYTPLVISSPDFTVTNANCKWFRFGDMVNLYIKIQGSGALKTIEFSDFPSDIQPLNTVAGFLTLDSSSTLNVGSVFLSRVCSFKIQNNILTIDLDIRDLNRTSSNVIISDTIRYRLM